MGEETGTLIDRDGLAEYQGWETSSNNLVSAFNLDDLHVYIVLNWSGEIIRAFAQPLDGSGGVADWPYWMAEA